jgi:uncharacterized protein
MLVRKPTEQEISSTDNWGIWNKEPSTFDWYYDEKETCYILSGSAEVTDKKGNKITFSKGDWVEFEVGLSCVWKINETIKKRYKFG